MYIEMDKNKSDEDNIFFKKENMNTSWKMLEKFMTNPITQKPYDWFLHDHKAQGGVKCKDGKLIFGGKAGPDLEITTYTHELGHLMITPDHDIGKNNWGLGFLHYHIVGDEIYPIVLNPKSQLKVEAKVWAWQYIIESLIGFNKFGDSIRPLNEARYLDSYGDHVNIENAHIAFNKALNDIMDEYTDLYELENAIRSKFIIVSDLIKENIELINNFQNSYEENVKEEKNLTNTYETIEHSVILNSVYIPDNNVNMYEVIVQSVQLGDGFKNIHSPYIGTDKEKAYKVFNKNAEINGLLIKEKKMEISFS